MKTIWFFLLVVISGIIPWVAPGVKASNAIEWLPTENHHVMELNSNQPYVAGFHVSTPNLETRETALATAITVSFPSTDTSCFPPGSWLGGGMFVQAQTFEFRHVDYGFYTMLVLDAEGTLFVDVGLHQTREATPPFNLPTEQLLYAYTWQISGVDPATPVTLSARWDLEGWVHYSVSASGSNVTLQSVNIIDFPSCEPIIRRFFAGNCVVMPFPFTRYVHYFQFGVVSSTSIASNCWSVDLREPRLLKRTGWALVDTAWSVQGDISYLDGSWMWGGAPYRGVSAHYHQNPLENPYEVVFFYNGQTLQPGTVFWQCRNPNPDITAAMGDIHVQLDELELLAQYIVSTLLAAAVVAVARTRSSFKSTSARAYALPMPKIAPLNACLGDLVGIESKACIHFSLHPL